MVTLVLRREAAYCCGCMKTHQIRLIDRSGQGVAVMSGRDLKFPGLEVPTGEAAFALALALVIEFTAKTHPRCPLEGMTA